MTYRLVMFGSGNFGIPSFEALQADPRFTCLAVVSQPAAKSPDGLRETPVARWAVSQSLPLLSFESLKHEPVEIALRQHMADVYVVIDYGLILPSTILTIPSRGTVNLHGSLLPKHRGAAPIPAAILAGDTEAGVTAMVMDAGIDTGPIIAQASRRLEPDVTTPKLSQYLANLGATLLPDTLANWLDGQITPIPQPPSPDSYAKKLSKADGQAVWTSGLMLERKIRAYQPWPGVWSEWQGKRLLILAANFTPGHPAEPLGTVVLRPGNTWGISCGDGWIDPTQVQMSGKKPQPASTIPGSYPGFVGTRLA